MIRYIIEGILVVALFIGSTMLCTVAPLENSGPFDAIAASPRWIVAGYS